MPHGPTSQLLQDSNRLGCYIYSPPRHNVRPYMYCIFLPSYLHLQKAHWHKTMQSPLTIHTSALHLSALFRISLPWVLSSMRLCCMIDNNSLQKTAAWEWVPHRKHKCMGTEMGSTERRMIQSSAWYCRWPKLAETRILVGSRTCKVTVWASTKFWSQVGMSRATQRLSDLPGSV
jgi:hypothetical protein